MKKIVVFLLLLSSKFSFSQVPQDIHMKALGIAEEYQTIIDLTSAEAQEIMELLENYLYDVMNGIPVDESIRQQVNTIQQIINTHDHPLSASTVLTSFHGELTYSDPTFHRIDYWSATFDNTCITQGNLSPGHDQVPYDIIELIVTQAGTFDIEVMEYGPSCPGIKDTYFSLYCHFDPTHPRETYICGNDDGGSDYLSRLEDIPLPVGTYSLVLSTYRNDNCLGPYTIEFRSDDGRLTVNQGHIVPFGLGWMALLFALLAVGILLKKFFF